LRTDRFILCRDCHARFSPAPACPRCGRSHLRDLRRREARPPAGSPGPAWLTDHPGAAIVLFLVAILAAPAAVSALRHDMGAGQVVLAVEIVALGALGLLVLWLRSRRADPRLELLPVPKPDGDAPRRAVRGRVEAPLGELLTAPLTGARCVAHRIVGETPRGPVDDAAATDFVVAGDPGGPVQVRLGEATIALPVPAARPVASNAALRAFLGARGLKLGKRALPLAQAILVVGDAVEVEGSYVEAPAPDGYRDGEARLRVFREAPGSPLVIRRGKVEG
jgi:hypothetical protein